MGKTEMSAFSTQTKSNGIGTTARGILTITLILTGSVNVNDKRHQVSFLSILSLRNRHERAYKIPPSTEAGNNIGLVRTPLTRASKICKFLFVQRGGQETVMSTLPIPLRYCIKRRRRYECISRIDPRIVFESRSRPRSQPAIVLYVTSTVGVQRPLKHNTPYVY